MGSRTEYESSIKKFLPHVICNKEQLMVPSSRFKFDAIAFGSEALQPTQEKSLVDLSIDGHRFKASVAKKPKHISKSPQPVKSG